MAKWVSYILFGKKSNLINTENMIELNKGKVTATGIKDIICLAKVETIEDMYYNELVDTVIIIEITDDDISIISPIEQGIDYIPDFKDTEDENWETFWDFKTTLIFKNVMEAIVYLKRYKGNIHSDITTFLSGLETDNESIFKDKVSISPMLLHEFKEQYANYKVFIRAIKSVTSLKKMGKKNKNIDRCCRCGGRYNLVEETIIEKLVCQNCLQRGNYVTQKKILTEFDLKKKDLEELKFIEVKNKHNKYRPIKLFWRPQIVELLNNKNMNS